MSTHNENFIYNDWSVTWDWYGQDGTDVVRLRSSGTTTKASDLYDINKVQSVTISGTNNRVAGGYGWLSAITKTSGGNIVGTSLYVNLTATIYLVESDGTTKVQKASATGSAARGGSLSQYDHPTYGECNYTITNEDRANYKYVQIIYTASTSNSSVTLTKAYSGSGSFDAHGQGNPYCNALITIIDNIPVTINGTQLEAMKIDSSTVSSLKYNGTTIY